MISPQATPDTTVSEALALTSRSTKIFIAHRTACVGCALGRFCTLRDVARTYSLSLEDFVAELEHAALADPIPSKGLPHETTE